MFSTPPQHFIDNRWTAPATGATLAMVLGLIVYLAFRDKYLCGAQAYAASRTGDDRDLAVEPSHVVLPDLTLVLNICGLSK